MKFVENERWLNKFEVELLQVKRSGKKEVLFYFNDNGGLVVEDR